MKLNTVMVERAVTQLQADPIPEQHPVMPQLNKVFGDHTFFIDGEGLHIIEPGEPNDSGDATGKLVKVARWSDDNRTSLAPHQPELTDVVVVFGEGPDSAA